MSKLIDRMFPSFEISASAQTSRYIQYNHIYNLHLWPTRRHVQLAAAISALATTDDDSLYDKISAVAESPVPIANHGLSQLNRGKSGLDTMCGGGTSLVGMLLNGIEANGSDLNPVAVFASRINSYILPNARFFIEDLENEARNLADYLLRRCLRFYSPGNARQYIWAMHNQCSSCGMMYPLLYTNIVATGTQFDGDYYIRREDNEYGYKVVKNEPVEFMRGIGFRKTRCLLCGAENDYNLMLDRLKSGQLNIRMVYIIEKLSGVYSVRNVTKEDIDVLNGVEHEANSILPHCWNDEISSRMSPLAIKRLIFYRNWSSIFNPRQILVVANAIRYLRERGSQILGKKYGQEIIDAISMIIGRIALRNNVIFNQSITTPEIFGNALSTQAVKVAWAYMEISVHCVCEIILRTCARLRVYGENMPSNIVVNLTRSSATERNTWKGKKFDVIILDPPYGGYADYATFSSLMHFIYKLIPSCSYNSISGGVNDFLGYVIGNEISSAMKKSGNINSDNKARDILRVSTENAVSMLNTDGRLAIIFGNRTKGGWALFLDSVLLANGAHFVDMWPCVCESLNRRSSSLGNIGANINAVVVIAKEEDASLCYKRKIEIDRELEHYWGLGFCGYDFWVCALPYTLKLGLRGMDAVENAIDHVYSWTTRLVGNEPIPELDAEIIKTAKHVSSIKVNSNTSYLFNHIVDRILARWSLAFLYMQKIVIDSVKTGNESELSKASAVLLYRRMRYYISTMGGRIRLQGTLPIFGKV